MPEMESIGSCLSNKIFSKKNICKKNSKTDFEKKIDFVFRKFSSIFFRNFEIYIFQIDFPKIFFRIHKSSRCRKYRSNSKIQISKISLTLPVIRGIQVKKPPFLRNPPLLFPDLAGGRNFFWWFSLKRPKMRVLEK